MGAGGVTIACAACYLGLDAFGALGDALRRSPPFLLLLAAVALVSGGAFAWFQGVEKMVQLYFYEAALLRAADDRETDGRREHFGEERDDVDV